jgi:hypothetical protein
MCRQQLSEGAALSLALPHQSLPSFLVTLLHIHGRFFNRGAHGSPLNGSLVQPGPYTLPTARVFTLQPWRLGPTTPGPTTSTTLPAPAATTPVRALVFLPPCPLNWPALPLPPHHLPLSPQTPPAAAAAGGPPQLPPRPGCCCGCCCHCCCCHVMFCGGLGYCCCAPG